MNKTNIINIIDLVGVLAFLSVLLTGIIYCLSFMVTVAVGASVLLTSCIASICLQYFWNIHKNELFLKLRGNEKK